MLNPILEQNLDLWANVYFNNPPEKRDQAVADLLRELDATSAAPPASTPPVQVEPADRTYTAAERVHCPNCGRDNLLDHRFCGFCGSGLSPQAYAPPAPVVDAPLAPVYADPYQSSTRVPVYEEPVPGRTSAPVYAEPLQTNTRPPAYAEPFPPSSRPPAGEPLSVLGLSSPPSSATASDLEFLREKSFGGSYYEPDPGPRRRRYLFGFVAVALLAGAAYWQWPWIQSQIQPRLQSATATKPASLPAQAAPTAAGPTPDTGDTSPAVTMKVPAETTEQPPQSEPAAPAPVRNEAASAGRVSGDQVSGRQVSGNQTSVDHPAVDHASHSASAPQQTVTLAGNAAPAATPAVPDGQLELQQAKRYLEGRTVVRNTTVAAMWLWKAVSKQNTEADLLLADLYERGEGVSKSCDQARLLITAAAKKGAPMAADKLRTFDASGCK